MYLPFKERIRYEAEVEVISKFGRLSSKKKDHKAGYVKINLKKREQSLNNVMKEMHAL